MIYHKEPKPESKIRAPRPLHWDDYRVIFGHLREAVKASGMRRVDIAARLNKPKAYVSKVLGGQQVMTLIEIRDICRASGILFKDGWKSWMNFSMTFCPMTFCPMALYPMAIRKTTTVLLTQGESFPAAKACSMWALGPQSRNTLARERS